MTLATSEQLLSKPRHVIVTDVQGEVQSLKEMATASSSLCVRGITFAGVWVLDAWKMRRFDKTSAFPTS